MENRTGDLIVRKSRVTERESGCDRGQFMVIHEKGISDRKIGVREKDFIRMSGFVVYRSMMS